MIRFLLIGSCSRRPRKDPGRTVVANLCIMVTSHAPRESRSD